MTLYTSTARSASRTTPPDNWISIGEAAQDVLRQVAARRARFARETTIDAFGHHGRALDYGDFEDHPPVRRTPPATNDATWARRVTHALKSQLNLELDT